MTHFREEAAKRSVDGCKLLTSTNCPEVDIRVFLIMICLLSHGFLACNYLPVVIAFQH